MCTTAMYMKCDGILVSARLNSLILIDCQPDLASWRWGRLGSLEFGLVHLS